MNKKIKVYLQYPWKYPDSPYYKYLIKNPPNNIEYLNTKNQKGVLTNSRQLFFSHNIKRTIRSLIFLLKIPILNVRHTKSKEKFDLIHCAHCLSKNTDKPWVVDFEGDWQFFLGHENDLVRKRAKKLLINKNCKKIIVWTCAAKKRILKKFPEIKQYLWGGALWAIGYYVRTVSDGPIDKVVKKYIEKQGKNKKDKDYQLRLVP